MNHDRRSLNNLISLSLRMDLGEQKPWSEIVALAFFYIIPLASPVTRDVLGTNS